jgi:hypothetical protein
MACRVFFAPRLSIGMPLAAKARFHPNSGDMTDGRTFLRLRTA